MKRKLLMVILCVTVAAAAGGCIVSIKGDGCQSPKNMQHLELDSTIAEIDAVKMLGSESARLNVLRAIAHRPGLSPEARLHLIEAIHFLGSESAREEALMILAENPPSPPPLPESKPCEKETDD